MHPISPMNPPCRPLKMGPCWAREQLWARRRGSKIICPFFLIILETEKQFNNLCRKFKEIINI